MQDMLDVKLRIPLNAAPKLVDDIERYSALIALQSQMTGPASWYQKIA